MPNKPGILRDIRIKRVALVDSGANFDKKTGDGAHIMVWKASPTSAVHVDTTDWETPYEKANLTADSRNAIPDSGFAAVWTDASGKKRRKLPIHDAGHLAAARGRVDQADIPADVKAEARRKIEAATNKEKPVKKNWKDMFKSAVGLMTEPDASVRTTKAAELLKAADDMPDTDEVPVHKGDDPNCKCADCMAKRAPQPTELEKRMTAIEKQNADLVAENTNLKKSVSTEIEKRESDEMVTILKSFKHTSIDLTKDVPHFMKMRKSDPEGYARIMEIMKASDATAAANFSDIGTRRGTGEGSAWAQVEALADKIMEKGVAGVTKEQAIEKVLLDPKNQGLAKQYRAELQ